MLFIDTYDDLVEHYEGTGAVAGMADTRHDESAILGPRTNR
jgi:hypothetical protein